MCRLHLHQRLVVDPGARFGHRGDLGEREYALVLEDCGVAADLAPLFVRSQRYQDVGGRDEQADVRTSI